MACQQPFHFLRKPGERNQEFSFQLFPLLIICPNHVLAPLDCLCADTEYGSVGGFGECEWARRKASLLFTALNLGRGFKSKYVVKITYPL